MARWAAIEPAWPRVVPRAEIRIFGDAVLRSVGQDVVLDSM